MRIIKIYKLFNQFKHYEWGHPAIIPDFLGRRNEDEELPYAEMWMGTYKNAHSQIMKDDKLVKLAEISGELPFLFKLLAVEKPLSIQAHPNKTQAEEGFTYEEISGIALNAPTRNYKDPNHKPEIMCAISPFTLMAGFRETEVISRSLDEFLKILPQLKEIVFPIQKALNTGSLAVFFRILFGLSEMEKDYITTLVINKEISEIESMCQETSLEQWKLMKYFASIYPRDPALISPFYLNLLTLQPGQAIYVPAGVLHAYISGFAAELMSNSDNVLRGGLTPKHINIPELMNIVNFNPYLIPVYTPDPAPCFTFQTLCNDFTLSLIHGCGNEAAFPVYESAICIVIEGELELSAGTTGRVKFSKGESFYIPQRNNTDPLVYSGNCKLFAAFANAS